MNHRGAAAMAAGLVLAAAGCGGDDEQSSAQKAKPAKLAIEVSGSAKSPKLSVPKTVRGGLVEIELKSSARGEHGAQLIRADAGHTPQEALEAGGAWGEKGTPLPSWVHIVGGVGSVKQGETASVTQKLEPGKYVVADVETDASAPFEVTGTGAPGEPTASGGTISAIEYGFEASGLRAGKNEVLFDNKGKEPHVIGAAEIEPGRTLAEVRRFIQTESDAHHLEPIVGAIGAFPSPFFGWAPSFDLPQLDLPEVELHGLAASGIRPGRDPVPRGDQARDHRLTSCGGAVGRVQRPADRRGAGTARAWGGLPRAPKGASSSRPWSSEVQRHGRAKAGGHGERFAPQRS